MDPTSKEAAGTSEVTANAPNRTMTSSPGALMSERRQRSRTSVAYPICATAVTTL